MSNFSDQERYALYLINNLRADEHTVTRTEVEAVVDTTALQSLENRGDVHFDESGNLTYAPYPRR